MRGTDPSSDLAVVEIDPGAGARRRDAVAPGRLPRRAGRRRGDRDRQPLRPRPHRHGGHRLRSRARDPGSERLLDRLRDPDRRTDQPGELGRAPARRERARHRRQLPDRDGRDLRATSGSASRCRPTPCARWCRPSSAASRSSAPTWVSRRRRRRCRARSGAQVQSVVSGGPADRAGIRTGDVITRIDGKDVGEPSDVTQALSDDRPGKVVDRRAPAQRVERDRERDARNAPRLLHPMSFAVPGHSGRAARAARAGGPVRGRATPPALRRGGVRQPRAATLGRAATPCAGAAMRRWRPSRSRLPCWWSRRRSRSAPWPSRSSAHR